MDEWVSKNDAAGKRIIGDRVRPAGDATTVRRRDGKVLVTDGPFAESRAGCSFEAVVAFNRAIELSPSDRERQQLARRRDELDGTR